MDIFEVFMGLRQPSYNREVMLEPRGLLVFHAMGFFFLRDVVGLLSFGVADSRGEENCRFFAREPTKATISIPKIV